MDPIQIQAIGIVVVTALVELIKRFLTAYLPADVVGPILAVVVGIVYSLLTGQAPDDGAGIGGLSAILFKLLHYFAGLKKPNA